MQNRDQIVAIRRDGETVCKACPVDYVESTVMADPDNEGRTATEYGIVIVRGSDLKGGEKCSRCGAKIVVKQGEL